MHACMSHLVLERHGFLAAMSCFDKVCPPWGEREGQEYNSVGNEHSTLGAGTTLLPP